MRLVLDAGALIALERSQRSMWVRLKAAHLAGEIPITHGGIIGQVWRGGPHQARLAQALKGISVHPLDESLGRSAGKLLGTTKNSDVIDAALVLLANDGDLIVTSDTKDLRALVAASSRHVELIEANS